MGDRLDIPLPSGPFEVVVVLVGVSHPGNLGAICRSMLNYGFDCLRLVNPKTTAQDGDAVARAKHASIVLKSATTFASIDEAVADCTLVVGTSGKREVGEKTLYRHFLYPWDMVQRVQEQGGRLALVFGEEGKGLSTEQLDECDFLVTLPTWEGYPIANLSHAVNALLYEIHRNRVLHQLGEDPGLPQVVPLENILDPSVRQALVLAIEQFASASSTAEERKRSVELTLRRTLLKGGPSSDEATRLIGAFVEATTALEFASGDAGWKKEHRRRLR